MSNERERIDRLLAEGKISTEEAERLRAAMDKSEAREPATPEPVAKPRLSRLAIASALGLPAAIIVGLLVYAFSLAVGGGTGGEREHFAACAGWAAMLGMMLGGFFVSIAALAAIRRAPDRLRGRGLAVLGLVAPLAAGLLMLMWFSFDTHGLAELTPPGELSRLWDKCQTLLDSDQPVGLKRVTELMEPGWAKAVSTARNPRKLLEGTIFGTYPREKEGLSGLLCSGTLGEIPPRPGRGSNEMVITYGKDVMYVPVVQIDGRWYFARGPVEFGKRGDAP